MLHRLIGVIRWVIAGFGPLIVFWGLDLTVSLKAAIAGSVVLIIVDSLWRWWRHLEFSRLYILISGLTVGFGAIDLVSATPFMLKYEAVITNIVIGAMLVAGARGSRPLALEVVEQQHGEPFPNRPDVIRFYQIFTLIWAVYFFAKAGLYLILGQMMPMAQAMAVRSVFGTVSMLLLMAFCVLRGRWLFLMLRRRRWLPPARPVAEVATTNP
jgi:intracellular septation protein A